MGKHATKKRPRSAYLGGYPSTNIEQITADLIAWQESGFSTDGMALPPVFATVRLIASTIDQLDLAPTDGSGLPNRLRNPHKYPDNNDSGMDLGDLIQYLVTSMALHGHGYLLFRRNVVTTGDGVTTVRNILDPIDPGQVQGQVTLSRRGVPVRRYMIGPDRIDAMTYAPRNNWDYIIPVPYLVTPQHPFGCSPITVARESLHGYFAVERQAANLLGSGTYSGGRLETDQDITAATAERYQTRWIDNRAENKLPVLGAGLRYVNDLISPTDAQWLESRQFNAQQIAQMFGVPTDYLGMAMAGGNSSLSYSNAQDNDRRFRRNCLEHFTSQIEDALSPLLFSPGRNEDDSVGLAFDYAAWESSGEATV